VETKYYKNPRYIQKRFNPLISFIGPKCGF